MKIAWLNDRCPHCSIGGAEFNDRGIIKKGIERGYEIRIITPHNFNYVKYDDCDCVIISNCVSFNKDILKKIVNTMQTIIFHHDFFMCNHRLYLPLQKKCYDCINKPIWTEIMKKAKLNIFLSPLHYEVHKKIFGEEVIGKKVCIPSCLDVDKWKSIEGVERKKGTVVGVNSLLPFKCRYPTNEYVEKHPELKFVFIGDAPQINHNNCDYINYVKNEDLPKVYSEYEYFIQLNQGIEPFCRAVTEAYLCGCKIIKNDNVGFFSYGDKELMKNPWDFSDRDQVRFYLSQASAGFWEEILKSVKLKDEVKI